MSELPSPRLKELKRKIHTVGHIEGVVSVLMSEAIGYGLTHYHIGIRTNLTDVPERRYASYTNWDIPLLEERARHKSNLSDPVAAFALGADRPFSWDEAYQEATQDHRLEADRVARFGLTCGYAFPFHDEKGLLGLVSLGGGKSLSPTDDQDLIHLESVSRLAFHRMLELSITGRNELGQMLSRMEQDVIRFSAMGSSIKEIGHILGVTDSAVKDAQSRARQKLGARNTTHACVIAIGKGLIRF